MKDCCVPFEFCKQKVELDWPELLWGYKNQYITWEDLVKVANEKILNGSNDETEIEMATVDKNRSWQVLELAESLARKYPSRENYIKEKWLFLVLAWVFENQKDIKKSLEIVSDIYADFEYPSEMESFVFYMPPNDGYDPTIHSEEENLLRLKGKWKAFLDQSLKILEAER